MSFIMANLPLKSFVLLCSLLCSIDPMNASSSSHKLTKYYRLTSNQILQEVNRNSLHVDDLDTFPRAQRLSTRDLEVPYLTGTVAGANVTKTKRIFLNRTATLDCKVNEIRKESVSWMRQSGETLKLISYDEHIYASDHRYQLKIESGANWKGWKLIIKNTELSDRGLYRCQVATKPILVLNILLNIIEPHARITDDREVDVVEKHYNSGSMIELKCIVENAPIPSDPIVWKKGQLVLSFNTSRGGISQKQDSVSGRIMSKLYVTQASPPRDSGIYSCSYGNLSNDTVAVHIISGEYPAAMQHDVLSKGIITVNANVFLVMHSFMLFLIAFLMSLNKNSFITHIINAFQILMGDILLIVLELLSKFILFIGAILGSINWFLNFYFFLPQNSTLI